jgi:hypothetical protein
MIFVVFQNLLHLNVYHWKVKNFICISIHLCFYLIGNPLAFTAAYEQIILSQSQTSANKQDSRQPMNIVNKSNFFF